MSSLRARIAMKLVNRQLPKLMSADPVAHLHDGLHVAVVGSGSPLPDVKRRSPCAAIIAGGKVYVIDAGEGASETMARMQLAPGRIEAILMTHYHSDHISGLGTVNLQRWVADGDRPALRVIGPPGVERVIGGFNEAYTLDDGYRVGHHGAETSSRIGLPEACAASNAAGVNGFFSAAKATEVNDSARPRPSIPRRQRLLSMMRSQK